VGNTASAYGDNLATGPSSLKVHSLLARETIGVLLTGIVCSATTTVV
jgi:hypothetical protein